MRPPVVPQAFTYPHTVLSFSYKATGIHHTGGDSSIVSEDHGGSSAGQKHKSWCPEDRCGNQGGRSLKGPTHML